MGGHHLCFLSMETGQVECACGRSEEEPDLGWDACWEWEEGKPDSALNLFHSLFLCRLGTLGPVRDF